MNDFLQQFLIESREFVVQATDGLLVLEKMPHDAETLDTVFRAFHTLKGGAGIVEFAAMENALHSTETLLQEARTGKRALDPAFIGDCLASLDQVSRWLDMLEQTGELPASPAPTPIGASPASQDWLADLLERHPDSPAQAFTAFRFVPDADCFYKGEDPIAQVASLSQLLALDIEPVRPWPLIAELDPYTCNMVFSGLTGGSSDAVAAHLQSLSGDCEVRSTQSANSGESQVSLPDSVRKVLQEQLAILDVQEKSGAAGRRASAGLTAANALRFCGLASHAEKLAHAAQQALAQDSKQTLRDAIALQLAEDAAPVSSVAAASAAPQTPTVTRTIRVNAEQIDALVRLTGELGVAKNAMGHTARLAENNGDSMAALLKEHHAALTRLIAQLQSSVIGMRVLPLRTVFQRFPRVLREMSSSLGKPAQIVVEGEDTEADKTIVEMLFEPLLHVVRNAIDHGVEDAEVRRTAGKAPVATILLRAARDGERILVEVTDDGRGIDVEKVRKIAKDRGVASGAELRTMPESEVIDLVFAPGFSTANRITEISGRGVGMDAVRTAVEKVGGRVAIASRPNRGTTVSFSLPYSVMMTQVMTVEAGGQVFGIPLDAVVETVSVANDRLSGVGEARVIVHRNRTIPILDLGSVLHAVQEKSRSDPAEVTVIITAIGGELVGLLVERVGERMEIILKPLDGLLLGTPGIAGTTVLGDGRVLLVLDILGILQ
jgi:two-component system, chemotaxis family, sensor kinase CheA